MGPNGSVLGIVGAFTLRPHPDGKGVMQITTGSDYGVPQLVVRVELEPKTKGFVVKTWHGFGWEVHSLGHLSIEEAAQSVADEIVHLNEQPLVNRYEELTSAQQAQIDVVVNAMAGGRIKSVALDEYGDLHTEYGDLHTEV